MPLHIRPATPDDAELILRFITDLAIYEKAEHEVKTDAAGIRDSLFAEGSTAHGLICENGGQPIGYAVYFFNYLRPEVLPWPDAGLLSLRRSPARPGR